MRIDVPVHLIGSDLRKFFLRVREEVPSGCVLNNQCYEFINKWFFEGLTEHDLSAITPRSNVNRDKALKIISHILGSNYATVNRKISVASFLLNEWFEIKNFSWELRWK